MAMAKHDQQRDDVSLRQFINSQRQSANWLNSITKEIQRHTILIALRDARGNRSQAAEMLGVSRPFLYDLIRTLRLRKRALTKPNGWQHGKRHQS
jgi:DNA-binding NtrC family response regulator